VIAFCRYKNQLFDCRFVKYKNCVLIDEMFKSGVMERLSSFQARPGDVFVASFPKSGTTWLQEVVYQIYLKSCNQVEENLIGVLKSFEINGAFFQDQSLQSLTPSAGKINFENIVNHSNDNMEDRFPYLENVYPGRTRRLFVMTTPL